MKTYIVRPELTLAFVPGLGRVRGGTLVKGDYDHLLDTVFLPYEEAPEESVFETVVDFEQHSEPLAVVGTSKAQVQEPAPTASLEPSYGAEPATLDRTVQTSELESVEALGDSAIVKETPKKKRK